MVYGELCLRPDKSTGTDYVEFYDMLYQWLQQEQKFQFDEITKDQYDQWRYTYPKMEVQRTRRDLDALREKRKAENSAD